MPPRRSGRSGGSIFVLAILVAAAIGGGAWYALGESDDAVPEQEPVVTSALDIEAQDVTSPLLVPIEDANDVIEAIDENSTEAEALDLLGLDETGNPISAATNAAGYRFVWSYGTAETATVIVDATTGNFDFEVSDGTEWRRVDGTVFSRRDDLAWTLVDGNAFGSIQRLGLDAPLTIEQLVDPVTNEFTASAGTARDDGTSQVVAEIDAFAYAAARPDAFGDWMAQLGHPSDAAAIAPGDVVVVQAELATDARTIDLATVTTTTLTTSYELVELFETAPVIESPEL
jgi:hypothetical protein